MKDTQPGEIWEVMMEGEGLFISNFGRIYREAKVVTVVRQGKIVERSMPAKFLSTEARNEKGYVIVKVSGDAKTARLHRLVAKYFLPNPENKAQINHKDTNKTNNRADNLEWSTNQENRDHAVVHDLHAKGEGHGNSILTDEIIFKIRELYKDGQMTQKAIGEIFGINDSIVSRIINKKIWAHVR
jgi:predicted XRE-type DNA-binding protein